MERVLAIDPGERVGWAVTEMTDEAIMLTDHGITEAKYFLLDLADTFNKYDTVIVETWRLQAGYEKKFTGSDFPTVQTIGAIRLLSWLHPHVKLVPQHPNEKKTGQKFAAGHLPEVAELLARLPKSHDDAHDGDAVMHLVAYYFNTRVK